MLPSLTPSEIQTMNRTSILLSLTISSFMATALAATPAAPAPAAVKPAQAATQANANTAGSIPQSGLIADIPFTEQTGTVANDTTGNGNACTFATGAGAPAWNGIGIGFG